MICKLLCRNDALQDVCGLENTPKTQGQTSLSKMHAMEACVAFHKRVEIFKREFVAIGENGPFGKVRYHWFQLDCQERGWVNLHGKVCCETNSISDGVICATMPRESVGFDPKFTAYPRELYKECNMYPDK